MEPTNPNANTHSKTNSQTLFDTPVKHSTSTPLYAVLLRDALVEHSCGTLSCDTLVGHSCGTFLLILSWNTLAGHSCGTLSWDTLVGCSCGDALVGHSCGTHSCGTLMGKLLCGSLVDLWDSFAARHGLVGHSCALATRRIYTSIHQHALLPPISRKRTFHRGCTQPRGTATLHTSCRHTARTD